MNTYSNIYIYIFIYMFYGQLSYMEVVADIINRNLSIIVLNNCFTYLCEYPDNG